MGLVSAGLLLLAIVADPIEPWELQRVFVSESPDELGKQLQITLTTTRPDGKWDISLADRQKPDHVWTGSYDKTTGRIFVSRRPTPDELDPKLDKKLRELVCEGVPDSMLKQGTSLSRIEWMAHLQISRSFWNHCNLTLSGNWYPGKITGEKAADTEDEFRNVEIKTGTGSSTPRRVSYGSVKFFFPQNEWVKGNWDAIRGDAVQIFGTEFLGGHVSFLERASMRTYGSLWSYVFKALMAGFAVTGAVGAETAMGKLAQNVFENTFGDALTGNASMGSVMSGFVEFVGGEMGGKLYHQLSGKPYSTTIENVAGKGAEMLAGLAKDQGADALAAKMQNQCRIEVMKFNSDRATGIAIIDQAEGSAKLMFVFPPKGARGPVVIYGNAGGLPMEGEGGFRPLTVMLTSIEQK